MDRKWIFRIITSIVAVLAMVTGSVFTPVFGQIYHTDKGYVKFFSSAPLEDIKAENQEVISFLNIENGELAFKVKISHFDFKKELMKEHFNENYLESETYPYATFKGKIKNWDNITFEEGTPQDVMVEGTLEIHGVSKDYTSQGVMTKDKEQFTARSVFNVSVADHEIKIPTIVFKNIAEVVEVTVETTYTPYTKSK